MQDSPFTLSNTDISYEDDYVDITIDEWPTIDSIGHGIEPEDVLSLPEGKFNFRTMTWMSKLFRDFN